MEPNNPTVFFYKNSYYESFLKWEEVKKKISQGVEIYKIRDYQGG